MPAFHREQEHKKENWFVNTAMRATIIAGFGFGLHMAFKGPATKLLKKYQQAVIDKEIEKSVFKAQDNFFGPEASIAPFNREHELQSQKMEEIKKAQLSMWDEDLARATEKKEKTMFRGIELDLNAHLRPFGEIIPRNLNFSNEFIIDETLVEGRLKALRIFLDLRGPGSLLDRAQNGAIAEVPVDKILAASRGETQLSSEKVKAIHEYLIRTEPDYVRGYKRILDHLQKNYEREMAVQKTQRKLITPGEAKKALYAEPSVIQQYEKYALAGKIQGTISFAPSENMKNHMTYDDLKAINFEVTGKSLSKTGFKPIRGTWQDKLGDVDFGPSLRRINTILDKFNRGETVQQNNVKGATMAIVQDGQTKKGWTLKLTLVHANGERVMLLVPIPQHGEFTGASVETASLMDRYQKTKIDIGFSTPREIQVNLQSLNILNKLEDVLQGSLLETSFKNTPRVFANAWQRILRSEVKSSPREVGEARDEYRRGGVGDTTYPLRNPRNTSARMTSKRISMGLESLDHLRFMSQVKKRISGGGQFFINGSTRPHSLAGGGKRVKGVLSVNLDIETLSRNMIDVSPNATAIDLATQTYKAGISVVSVGSGPSQITHVEEVVSDHAYNYFDRLHERGENLWSKNSVNWMRKTLNNSVVAKDGKDDEVRRVWQKENAVESANSRIRNRHGQFRTEVEMWQHISNRIESLIKDGVNQGYEVVLSTKGGSAFDLKRLETFNPTLHKLISKSHIDVESISYLIKRAFDTRGSLKLNVLLQEMMGRFGLNATDYEIKEGGIFDILEQMSRHNKGNHLKVDTNIKSLMSDIGCAKAHSSGLADSIASQILLLGSLFEFDNRDERLTGVESVKNQLGLGRKSLGFDGLMSFLQSQEGQIVSVAGKQVGSATYAGPTSGMKAKNIRSLTHANMMTVFNATNLGKQIDQYAAGAFFMEHSSYHTADIATRRKIEKQIKGGRVRTELMAGSEQNIIMKSNTNANYFQNTVKGKTLFLLNSFGGQEGMARISTDVYNSLRYERPTLLNLNSQSFMSDVVLSQKMHDYQNELVRRIQVEAKRQTVVSLTGKEIEKIAFQVSNDPRYAVHITPGLPITIYDDEGKVHEVKSPIGGKVVNIITETGNVTQHAKIMYAAEGMDMLRMAIKHIHSAGGSKAMTSVFDPTLSAGLAYGGAQYVLNADFMEKVNPAAYKKILTDQLWDTIIDAKEHNNPRVMRRALRLEKLLRGRMSAVIGKNNDLIVDKEAPARFKYRGEDPNGTPNQRMVLGNINLSIEKLHSYLRATKVTEVWTEEHLKEFYGIFDKIMFEGGTSKLDPNQRVKKLTQWVENQTKDIKFSEDFLHEKSPVVARKQLVKQMCQILLPKLGDPITLRHVSRFGLADKSKDTWSIGFMAEGSEGSLIPEAGREFRNMPLKIMRKDIESMERMGNYINPLIIADVKKNLSSFHDRVLQSAWGSIDKFNKIFYTQGLMKHLSLEELSLLTSSQRIDELRKQLKRSLQPEERAAISKRWSEMVKLDETDDKAVLGHMDTAQSLLDDIEKSVDEKDAVVQAKYIDNYTMDYWARLAHDTKRKGVFSITKQVKGKNLGSFEIKNVYEFMKTQIWYDNDTARSTAKVDRLMELFTDVFKERPDGMVESLILEGGVAVNNKIEFDKVKKSKVVGVRLRHLVTHADDDPHLLASQRGTTIGYKSTSTRSAFEVYNAAEQFMNAVSSSGYEHQSTKDKEGILLRQWLNYTLHGMVIDKDSPHWKAQQLYTPFGAMGPALSIAPALEDALAIKTAGGGSTLAGLSRIGFTGGEINLSSGKTKYTTQDASSFLDSFLKQDMSTVWISQEKMENLQLDVMKNGQSRRITWFRHLEETMLSEGKSKDEVNAFLDRVRMGQQEVYGYMGRYPLEQSGSNKLMSVMLKAIPKPMSPIIYQGNNGILSHPIEAIKQNADFDGDQGAIKALELSCIDTLQEQAREHRAYQKNALNMPWFQKIIEERNYDRPANIGAPGEGPTYINYSIDGQVTIQQGDPHKLRSKLLSQTAKLSQEAMETDPLIMSANATEERVNQALNITVQKDVIGRATSAGQVRSHAVEKVGLVKNARVMQDLIGTRGFGIAGIQQIFLDVKRKPFEVAKLSKAMTAWQSTNPNGNPEGFKSLKDLWVQQYEEGYGVWDEQRMREMIPEMPTEIKTRSKYATWLFEQGQSAYRKLEYASRYSSRIRNVNSAEMNQHLGRESNLAEGALVYNQADFEAYQELTDRVNAKRAVITPDDGLMGGFKEKIWNRFKLNSMVDTPQFKAGTKLGAIVAGAAMAVNFFTPMRLGDSIGPDGAYNDLGDHNAIRSELELDRNIPLATVDASFSKQAYIKMNSYQDSNRKKGLSVINNALGNSAFFDYSTPVQDFGKSGTSNYSNYTTRMGYFGSPDFYRKSQI